MATLDDFLNPQTPEVAAPAGAPINGPPTTFVSPPGVNAAPPGAPSTTAPPFGAIAAPASGAASPPPSASQAPPSAAAGAGAPIKPQGMKINVTMPPALTAQAPAEMPRATIGPEGVGIESRLNPQVAEPKPLMVESDRVPQEHELDLMPPGAQVNTPMGVVSRDPTGGTRMALNEMGKQRYREASASAVKAYGKFPMSGRPGAPQPPVRLGKRMFDPFSNKMLGKGA